VNVDGQSDRSQPSKRLRADTCVLECRHILPDARLRPVGQGRAQNTYECLREALDTYPDKPTLVGRGDRPDTLMGHSGTSDDVQIFQPSKVRRKMDQKCIGYMD
jgi:hypothetical protein